MQQNQNILPEELDQPNQPGSIGQPDRSGQRQGINPGYVHPPSNGDGETDISEIPEEHHNKKDQHEFQEPTNEHQGRNADQEEHPHTGASFPKQDPAKGPDGKEVSNGKVF